MTWEQEQLALQCCERKARHFYWLLDRFESDRILAMVGDDCQWVRAGVAHVGLDAMRKIMDARPCDALGRHLICNAVASMATADEIEVTFDLLYLTAPKSAELGGQTTPSPTKLLSGLDRYYRKDGEWRLAFKEVLPLF
jgi:hypothetical protein